MKNGLFLFPLLALSAAFLTGCFPSPAMVCTQVERTSEACPFIDAPGALCESNLESCSGEDRTRWEEHQWCLEVQCRAGASQTEADDACHQHLEGVSWGCNPFS
jgi:hypothetical protein